MGATAYSQLNSPWGVESVVQPVRPGAPTVMEAELPNPVPSKVTDMPTVALDGDTVRFGVSSKPPWAAVSNESVAVRLNQPAVAFGNTIALQAKSPDPSVDAGHVGGAKLDQDHTMLVKGVEASNPLPE